MSKKYAISILFFVCLLGMSAGVYSMIRTLPVAELVSKSDYIVIGEVRKIEVDTTQRPKSAGMRYLRNEIIVTESLKGDWPIDRLMFFRTITAEHWIEDNVEFPYPGTQVLLFVRKGESGGLSLVNGIQGLWPLQEGKPLRMGTGKTVEEIKSLIRSQAGRKE
ncbi:MAG: hypothetical protein WC291_04090 [Thermodesulfovibrionales bacterium]